MAYDPLSSISKIKRLTGNENIVLTQGDTPTGNGRYPLEQLKKELVNKSLLGSVTPLTQSIEQGVYIASEVGVYPNFGNTEVSQEDFDSGLVLLTKNNDGTFSKDLVPMPGVLTDNDINVEGGVTGFNPIGQVAKGDKRAVSGNEVYLGKIKNIAEKWIPNIYSIGDKVEHNGIIWELKKSHTVADSEPGISNIWQPYTPYQNGNALLVSQSFTLEINFVTNKMIFTGTTTNRVLINNTAVFIRAQEVDISNIGQYSVIIWNKSNGDVYLRRNITAPSDMLTKEEYLIGYILNISDVRREIYGIRGYKLVTSSGEVSYPITSSQGGGNSSVVYNRNFKKYHSSVNLEKQEWINKAIIDVEFYNIGSDTILTPYSLGKNNNGKSYLGFQMKIGEGSIRVLVDNEIGARVFPYNKDEQKGVKTYYLRAITSRSNTYSSIVCKIVLDWDSIPDGAVSNESATNLSVNSLFLDEKFKKSNIFNTTIGLEKFAKSKSFDTYVESWNVQSYAGDSPANGIPISPFENYENWLLKWDELVTNAPAGYEIVKELLTDKVLSDNGDMSIYSYTFKPMKTKQKDVIGNIQSMPRILINCSIHGYEKIPSFITYELMKKILTNPQDNDFLHYLRHNVEFSIIPVANPYGWNYNNGAGSRKNFNGIDLNRNFDRNYIPGTDPSSSTYSGITPLSESESIAINNWIEKEVGSNTILAIDFHNFHGSMADYSNPEDYFHAWIINCSSMLGQSCSNVLFKEISDKYKAKDINIPKSQGYYVGSTNNSIGTGMTQTQMRELGSAFSCTFELCQNWGYDTNFKAFDSNAMNFGMETFVNFLRVYLSNFIDEYNRI